MPYKPTDPLTDPTRQPDELRRLNLEQSNSSGPQWRWMAAAIAAAFVAMLVYAYTKPIPTMVTAPTSSSTTTGAAPAPPPAASPLAATPPPAPSTSTPDNR